MVKRLNNFNEAHRHKHVGMLLVSSKGGEEEKILLLKSELSGGQWKLPFIGVGLRSRQHAPRTVSQVLVKRLLGVEVPTERFDIPRHDKAFNQRGQEVIPIRVDLNAKESSNLRTQFKTSRDGATQAALFTLREFLSLAGLDPEQKVIYGNLFGLH